MFKKIRVVISCRLCCSSRLASFSRRAAARDWDDTLWVDVYLVNGDRLDNTQRYIDSIDAKEFDGRRRVLRNRSEALRRHDRRAVSVESRRPIPRRATGADAPVDARHDLVEPRDALARAQARLAEQRTEAGYRGVCDLSRPADFGRPRSDRPALRKGLIAVDEPVRVATTRAAPIKSCSRTSCSIRSARRDKYAPESNLPQFPDGFADPA